MFSSENPGTVHIRRVIFDADNLVNKTRPPLGFRLWQLYFLTACQMNSLNTLGTSLFELSRDFLVQ
jgi:hypothetical protein